MCGVRVEQPDGCAAGPAAEVTEHHKLHGLAFSPTVCAWQGLSTLVRLAEGCLRAALTALASVWLAMASAVTIACLPHVRELHATASTGSSSGTSGW